MPASSTNLESLPVPHILTTVRHRHLNRFFTKPMLDELKQCCPGIEFIDTQTFKPDEWIKTLVARQPDILITGWCAMPLPENILDVVPSLKYVCHLTGAVRNFIPKCLIEQGLLVTNWGASISHTVAECAVVLTQACLRELNHWSLTMHQDRSWKAFEQDTRTLFNRKIGIYGFGNVARKILSLLEPYNVSFAVYSAHVDDRDIESFGALSMPDLSSLFDWTDIIINVESFDGSNRGAVNEALLRKLQPDGIFVNIGRGSTVDEAALAKVAREGWLQVGLDVYETEPLPEDSPLRGLRNVTLLPHIAGPTRETFSECGRFALNNIKRYLRGEPLEAQITAQRYEQIT